LRGEKNHYENNNTDIGPVIACSLREQGGGTSTNEEEYVNETEYPYSIVSGSDPVGSSRVRDAARARMPLLWNGSQEVCTLKNDDKL
jgi:hypothetical protein